MKEASKESIANSIIRSLLKNKSAIDGRTILDLLSIYFDVDDAVLYSLLEKEIIIKVKSGKTLGSYKFLINEQKLNDTSLLKPILFSEDRRTNNFDFKLVASYQDYEELYNINDFENLYPMICRLIINSEKQLIMVNPFYDDKGIDMIMPYFKSASDRGVDIKIVSRRFNKTDKKDRSYIEYLNSFNNGLKHCTIRQFGGYIDNKPFHLHAKFMIADDKMAYLGSANMTEYSLGNNTEIGVIFTGEKVRPLINFFNLIWDNAKS